MHYGDIIKLQQLPGVGRKSILKLIQDFKGSESLSLDFKDYVNILSEKMNRKLPSTDLEKIQIKTEKILENCYNGNIGIITCFDDGFPKSFKHIGVDSPVLIYYKGNKSLLDYHSNIAVIGTRNPSVEGFEKAKAYSSLIADKGFVIVSGLAKGCDTAAHLGALKDKGRSIAVIPSGIGCIYPKSNNRLHDDIISNNGCIVSEYEPYALPQRYTFVERDRLQAALSAGLLIIESALAGGTNHTYRYGISYNKQIAVSEHASLNGYQMSLNREIIRDGNGAVIKSELDIEAWLDMFKTGGLG
ncbi:MAG: DNA-processing protein DprA [Eubacteriales bacterium]|nr:DNA-processing protein DprA [Eubacteriales bacterium]